MRIRILDFNSIIRETDLCGTVLRTGVKAVRTVYCGTKLRASKGPGDLSAKINYRALFLCFANGLNRDFGLVTEFDYSSETYLKILSYIIF